VFCEGVQHSLRFCLDHLKCVKMAAIWFHPQSWKQKYRREPSQASRVGGVQQLCCSWLKIPW
jgi:hypothetical protein